jgi:antitoxin ParD1/3/4
MTTMSISLPEEMKAFIEAQMTLEGFASAGEYLRALIHDAQRRQAKKALEARFQEALESGPATPMTPEDWVALRREAIEGLAGESIRP